LRGRRHDPKGAARFAHLAQRHQSAFGQIALGEQPGHGDDAEARNRRIEPQPGIGDLHHGRIVGLVLAGAALASGPFDPPVAVITGRGNGDKLRRTDLRPLELRRPIGKADRAIEIGFGKIDIAVARNERVADFGIGGGIADQPVVQPFGGKVARHRDRQAKARLALLHRAHCLLELQEAAAQRVEPGARLIGQLKPLGRATEQHDAEHFLERTDLLADGGRRHRQFVGGAGKAQMPGGGVEHAQAVERKMGTLHGKRGLIGNRRGDQRKTRDFHRDHLPVVAQHAVHALHPPGRGVERTARDIVMRLARLDHRLFADHALAIDLVHAAAAIGDHPVAGEQLHRLVRMILDADVIGPEPAGAVGTRTVGQKAHRHPHRDALGGGRMAEEPVHAVFEAVHSLNMPL
jgi:hypothetical protein